MAETYSLDAQSRTVIGKKVGQLRRQGLVPAVVYGAKRESFAVQIPERALTATLAKAGGTHLINLSVDGTPTTVITREVQRDIIRGNITHVDFVAVDASTRIRADIPVHYVDESPAVSARLGILLYGTQTITIEALPSDLIDRAEISIASLTKVGDSLHVRDLKLGDKVTVLNDGDDMLVRVTVTAANIAEEAAAVEVSSAEPEVITKGKQEEEDF